MVSCPSPKLVFPEVTHGPAVSVLTWRISASPPRAGDKGARTIWDHCTALECNLASRVSSSLLCFGCRCILIAFISIEGSTVHIIGKTLSIEILGEGSLKGGIMCSFVGMPLGQEEGSIQGRTSGDGSASCLLNAALSKSRPQQSSYRGQGWPQQCKHTWQLLHAL